MPGVHFDLTRCNLTAQGHCMLQEAVAVQFAHGRKKFDSPELPQMTDLLIALRIHGQKEPLVQHTDQ